MKLSKHVKRERRNLKCYVNRMERNGNRVSKWIKNYCK